MSAADKPGRVEKAVLHLPVRLTSAEVHDAGKVLAEGLRRLDEADERKKTFNQQMKAEMGNILASVEMARSKVATETEFRDVECEVRYFFNRNGGEKDSVRIDTGEVVRTEKVSGEDRQREFGKP